MVIQHDETTENWIEFCDVLCLKMVDAIMAIFMGKMLLSRWIMMDLGVVSLIFQIYFGDLPEENGHKPSELTPQTRMAKKKSRKCVSPLVPKS